MKPAPPLVFRNGTAILPDRLLPDAVIVCREGKIVAVGPGGKVRFPREAEIVDARGGYLSPGFVDIHVHGGDGADYMDGTTEAVRTANRAHARHGTTSIFPTTTTGSPAQLDAMLEACAVVRREWTVDDGARVPGVHFYGPYFAEEKVGCHAKSGRRDPAAAEYRGYFKRGIIKVATCAAELPGAEAFFRTAARHGCLATCGHSNASWDEMARSYRAGMRHVDHFWCAMSSVPSMRARFGPPMRGSMAEFVLMHREMSTEVIADGQHLAPELLRFAFFMKGAERLCLVTDANRALGMPPGDYRFGSMVDGPRIHSDGKVGRMPTGDLASSVVGMDTMVRTMARASEAPLPDVIRMASLTPAERAGVAGQVGSLAKGKLADVLVLDRKLAVKRVFIGGCEHRVRRLVL
ncbi:MAG: N-acetylglucosamine-6-phosphate deacetylase [Opitutaceae bacterium]|nr:N-acetylglucosamine-6-phosphate deacetylase [Opitutaceae bacterium]